MRTETPPRCPRCGSDRVVPYAYGLPIPDLVAAEERGEVLLAGCVVDADSPAFHCRACGRDLPQPAFP
jgi:hypothetical protein